jgi:hypothetical protein
LDGFHRYFAKQRNRRDKFACEVRPGTKRDAILHAVGANAEHGLKRTDADKRRAVNILLDDPEWSQWSGREIARQCKVSESLVRTMRAERESHLRLNADTPASNSDPERGGRPERLVTRGGTTYRMSVDGRSQTPVTPAPSPGGVEPPAAAPPAAPASAPPPPVDGTNLPRGRLVPGGVRTHRQIVLLPMRPEIRCYREGTSKDSEYGGESFQGRRRPPPPAAKVLDGLPVLLVGAGRRRDGSAATQPSRALRAPVGTGRPGVAGLTYHTVDPSL